MANLTPAISNAILHATPEMATILVEILEKISRGRGDLPVEEYNQELFVLYKNLMDHQLNNGNITQEAYTRALVDFPRI